MPTLMHQSAHKYEVPRFVNYMIGQNLKNESRDP